MALQGVMTKYEPTRSDILTMTRLVLVTAQPPLDTYYIDQRHSEGSVFNRIPLTDSCRQLQV